MTYWIKMLLKVKTIILGNTFLPQQIDHKCLIILFLCHKNIWLNVLLPWIPSSTHCIAFFINVCVAIDNWLMLFFRRNNSFRLLWVWHSILWNVDKYFAVSNICSAMPTVLFANNRVYPISILCIFCIMLFDVRCHNKIIISGQVYNQKQYLDKIFFQK